MSEAAKQRAFVRLLETMQFVLDVMGCTSDGGDFTPLHGESWKSVIRVRMLHAITRRRIMLKMKRKAPRSAAGLRCPLGASEIDGLPINQEDLAATLASFSVAPLWCLGRFGFLTTRQQCADWMAIWRELMLLSLSDPFSDERFQVLSATIWASTRLFSPGTSHPMKWGNTSSLALW
jgi:ER-bound oxygenase mpaB/B'/Rubber oxygenase, catalytic domain